MYYDIFRSYSMRPSANIISAYFSEILMPPSMSKEY